MGSDGASPILWAGETLIRCQKNDAADAEAICEAVGRPTMRFVPARLAWTGDQTLERNVDALLQGEIDFIEAPPYADLDRIRRAPDLGLAYRPAL